MKHHARTVLTYQELTFETIASAQGTSKIVLSMAFLLLIEGLSLVRKRRPGVLVLVGRKLRSGVLVFVVRKRRPGILVFVVRKRRPEVLVFVVRKRRPGLLVFVLRKLRP